MAFIFCVDTRPHINYYIALVLLAVSALPDAVGYIRHGFFVPHQGTGYFLVLFYEKLYPFFLFVGGRLSFLPERLDNFSRFRSYKSLAEIGIVDVDIAKICPSFVILGYFTALKGFSACINNYTRCRLFKIHST